MTRARRHGFHFERHELEPLGIQENGRCWGLWVEGRGFDTKVRLDDPTSLLAHESPQLGISPIHPSLWPTAFNLEVLIARRAVDDPANPSRCDAFLGLADALQRCGVNILFVQTAQVGYDLVCVHATCEFPRLRPAAKHLVDIANIAGRSMETCRNDLRDAPPNRRTPALNAMDDQTFRVRAAAFQALGLLMVPRLAWLEAQLLAMDSFRHAFEYATDLDRASLLNSVDQSTTNASATDGKFAGLVGLGPGHGADAPSRRDAARRAFASPWFLNRKVAEAGENTYFLSYYSVRDLPAMERAWPTDIPKPPMPSETEELTPAHVQSLYTHVHQFLRDRELSPSMADTIPISPGPLNGDRVRIPRSGVAERMLAFAKAEELERECYREFFHRQALLPVRVSALPSLAHMRFWAFGGSSGRGAFLPLRYRNGLLGPDELGLDSGMRLARVFEFLNEVTGATNSLPEGTFGPNAAVHANMHLRDRFVRLRFGRERTELAHYVTVGVEYFAKGQPPQTQGLLHDASRELAAKGFRIEHVANGLLELDDSAEKGRLDLIGRAVTPEAKDLCQRLRTRAPRAPSHPLEEARSHWAASLQTAIDPGRGVTISRVDIDAGFVPWDR